MPKLLNTKAAQARRRARRKALPRKKLAHAHTRNGQLLPDRLHLLDVMPKNADVAEIGVDRGDFSQEIVDRCDPKTLHLIDLWGSRRFKPAEKRVRERFAEEIEQGRIVIHHGLSTDKLPEFSDASLDWVYIDSSHSYEDTKAELEICDRIVRPGGLIAGHDFCNGNVDKPSYYGVVQAVNEFCVNHGWQYRYVTLESGAHFSFCLSRI